MFNQIISIDIIYYKLLSYIQGNESKYLSIVSKDIRNICMKYGYLFHLRLQRGCCLDVVKYHLPTIRSMTLCNYFKYPLQFYPSKIILDNTLMDLKINKINPHLSEISYQHSQSINIDFKNFPNIRKLHIKY